MIKRAVLIINLLLTVEVCFAPAQIVSIPDPNLRAAVEKALSKALGAPITAADMATLTVFEASYAKITDLTGLEHATNLTELYLWGNSISDLSALSGLTNLTVLDLDTNSISDLSALGGLTNLTALFLDGNFISDLSALSGLTNLTRLWLLGNSISDLSALGSLTNLTELFLDGNSISDLSALGSLTNLTELFLGDNSISDLSALSGLTNLTWLWLRSNSISDISPLVANTGLGERDRVQVERNPLSDLSIYTHIPTLQSRGVTVYFTIADTEVPSTAADVNGDGSINILDLVLIASEFGKATQNLAADVSGDGIVDILDLVLVAGMFGEAAAAPSAHTQAPETLTAVEVQQWLTNARALEGSDPIMKRGVVALEQLWVSLTPKDTELLANYPNPFNPETWIPYRLAADAFVTLTIYDGGGRVVRTLAVGHQIAAGYERRSKAIYWDGRNEFGEAVASGVYFYTLIAGDFSATRRMVILK